MESLRQRPSHARTTLRGLLLERDQVQWRLVLKRGKHSSLQTSMWHSSTKTASKFLKPLLLPAATARVANYFVLMTYDFILSSSDRT